MHKFLSLLIILLVNYSMNLVAMDLLQSGDEEKDHPLNSKRNAADNSTNDEIKQPSNKKSRVEKEQESTQESPLPLSAIFNDTASDEQIDFCPETSRAVFHHLPAEMVEYLRSYLDLHALANLSTTCRNFNNIVSDWLDRKITVLTTSENPACKETAWYFEISGVTSKTLALQSNAHNFMLYLQECEKLFGNNLIAAAEKMFDNAYFFNKRTFSSYIENQIELTQDINCSFDNKQELPLLILPKEVAKLSSLKKLSLKNNQLFFLPQELSELKNLEKLYLNSNAFMHFPSKVLLSLTALRHLDFQSNFLVKVPVEILDKAALQIDISNNLLTNMDPITIGKFSKLIDEFSDSNDSDGNPKLYIGYRTDEADAAFDQNGDSDE